MIEIALRFDDPSSSSDHDLERGILDILAELGVPATLAVVPFGRGEGGLLPLEAVQVSHLVQAEAGGVIEVAQHGYSHEPLSRGPDGAQSEFLGVAAAEQARRIEQGRRVLEGVFAGKIAGFVPPWNTFDAATTEILSRQGFGYLSAGMDAPPHTGICLIPRSSQATRLADAVAEARRQRPLSATIVSVLHHYDFRESRDEPGQLSLAEFRDGLKRLACRDDVRFVTLGRLAQGIGVAGGNAILARHRLKGCLHWRLQRHLPGHQLFTRPLWSYLR